MRAVTMLALTLLGACASDGTTDDGDDTTGGTDDTTVAGDDTAPGPYRLSLSAVRTDDPLGMFMSAWGTAADDVWIVGGQKDGGAAGPGFLLRGGPDSLDAVELPADTVMLTWVHGTGPDDVWLGGLEGTVLHWDGSGFTDHSVPQAGAVWGVHARAADDVLVVGGPWFGDGNPFLYRWDGTELVSLEVPDSVGDTQQLFKSYAIDEGYAVVGAAGVALVVDDDGVTAVSNGDVAEDMVTAHGHGTDLYAVGGVTAGRIWRWDGVTTGWTPVAETFSRLNGVHVLPDGTVVGVGNNGSAGTYTPDAGWTETDPFTFEVLHGVWVAPNGDTWAVGGNFLTSQPSFEGVVGFSPGG